MTSHISSKWHSFFAVSYMFLMQVTDYQKRHICLEKCILEIQFFNSNWNTFLAMDLCRNLQIVTEENILKYSRILVFLRSIPTHLLLYTSFSQTPQIQERSCFQAAIPWPTSCAEQWTLPFHGQTYKPSEPLNRTGPVTQIPDFSFVKQEAILVPNTFS